MNKMHGPGVLIVGGQSYRVRSFEIDFEPTNPYVQLGAFHAPSIAGGVTVTIGGVRMSEDVDFVIDRSAGTITLHREGTAHVVATAIPPRHKGRGETAQWKTERRGRRP